MEIDPWSSAQSTDYEGIISRFGLNRMEGLDLPNPTRLHRRGIVSFLIATSKGSSMHSGRASPSAS